MDLIKTNGGQLIPGSERLIKAVVILNASAGVGLLLIATLVPALHLPFSYWAGTAGIPIYAYMLGIRIVTKRHWG
jgi:hypothetical protein